MTTIIKIYIYIYIFHFVSECISNNVFSFSFQSIVQKIFHLYYLLVIFNNTSNNTAKHLCVYKSPSYEGPNSSPAAETTPVTNPKEHSEGCLVLRTAATARLQSQPGNFP